MNTARISVAAGFRCILGRIAPAWVALALTVACGPASGEREPAAPPSPPPGPGPLLDAAWDMHPISLRYRGANGLGRADVDGNGFADYVTNYEFDQRVVVSLHPGTGADPRAPWEQVEIFTPSPLAPEGGVNPESACFGDFDGDGRIDAALAQGYSDLAFWEGNDPGVRIFWGPGPGRAADPAAWENAGRVPATIDVGHLHWCTPMDVNGDGVPNVLVGGREHGGNRTLGGVRWLEPPADPALRRDLGQWRFHAIDAEQYSGHYAIPADVNQNGLPDVVLANHDFDTPAGSRELVWYENPGPDSPRLRGPWAKHVLYAGDEFHTKPQVEVVDLDRDGLVDLVTQVPDEVWWFRKTSSDPVHFERVVIPKDPRAAGIGRPIRVGDITGDGRPEIVGALTHVRSDLRASAFSVYWMQYDGDAPAADNWTTRVIKRGSGKTMLIPEFGEKWDQMHLADVDGDGDLDIVANCEEWWANPVGEWVPFFHPRADPESVSVVWFENRLDEMPRRAAEWDGTVTVEAEEPALRLDDTWVNRGLYGGWLGTGYVQHFNATPLASEFPFLRDRVPAEGPDALHRLAWEDTAGNTYDVDLAGGAYEVWVRCRVPGAFGYGLGGARSDGAWVGIDGRPLGVVRCGAVDTWTWVKLEESVTLEPGGHTLHLKVERRAFAVDRLLLSRRPGFTPGSS